MNEAIATLAVFAAFLVAFPLVWAGTLHLIARIGGWAALARIYASETRPAGQTFGWASARFGFLTSYGGCLTAIVSPSGLRLAPWAIFRPGHPPLFIPWSAVTEARPRRILFSSAVRLTIDMGTGELPRSLLLYGKRLSESIQRHAHR